MAKNEVAKKAETNKPAKQTKSLKETFQKAKKFFVEVISELKKHYSDKLFETKISRNVKLTEAPGFGRPVYYHDKNSKGAKEYLDVAKELANRI